MTWLRLHEARLRRLGVVAVIIGVAIVIYAVDPLQSRLCPSCLFHELTGLWCPGCGSTRALYQLLHGNFLTAFRLNPLVITLLPLACYLALRHGAVVLKPIWIWTLLAVVVAFGVVRNLPSYPFTLLAP